MSQTYNVFGQGPTDLYNAVQQTQAGLPHLMQFLWDKYKEYLKTLIEQRVANNQVVATTDENQAARKAPATHFVEWAAEYLEENRVSESFFIDENHGLRLTNQCLVAVSPGVDVRGTMQDAGAVPITEGKSQQDNDGIVRSGSVINI